VSCTFTGQDDGEYFEVWLNGTDDENCLVARLTFDTSAATLDIRLRVGGSDTVLITEAATAAPSSTKTLALYYDEDNTFAAAQVDSVAAICFVGADPVGDLAGIAVGPHGVTDVPADNFVYSQLGDGINACPEFPACPGPETCSACSADSNQSPPYVTVILGGDWYKDLQVSPFTTCATACTDIPGTYVLDFQSDSSGCNYYMALSPELCGEYDAMLVVITNTSTAFQLTGPVLGERFFYSSHSSESCFSRDKNVTRNAPPDTCGAETCRVITPPL
jgi:hypothetical protein